MASGRHAALAEDRAQSHFPALLRKGVSAHAIFFVIVFAYLLALEICGLAIPAVAQKSATELIIGIVSFSIPVAVVSLALFKFGEMALTDRPAHPIAALWHRCKDVFISPQRMAAGLPLFFSLLLFMVVFTSFKAVITDLAPFTWDLRFDQWDTALHFGYRPWELLHPVLGYAPVTWLINVNYNMWFIVMNLFWVYYAFLVAPGVERTRFFVAFMLVWIIGGTVAAVFFSSAGPCYFTRIGLSPDPYAGLMDYLHGVQASLPVWALDTQDMLWRYRSEGSAFGGVSARPSMHSATALLFVLTAWRKARLLRHLLIAHAALILVGSVHLGWHYAIDGYVAWIILLPCWFAAGKIARWWECLQAD